MCTLAAFYNFLDHAGDQSRDDAVGKLLLRCFAPPDQLFVGGTLQTSVRLRKARRTQPGGGTIRTADCWQLVSSTEYRD